MLLRIGYLRHIGRFKNLEQKAPQLGRLSLIFARNAYGKTTLSAVLRSVGSQDPRPINERIHLSKHGPPEAALEFSGGEAVFTNGSWARSAPPLLVFDAEFTRHNVHTADEVTRDNKRQMLRVIVGATGVSLAEEIAKLDKQNTELNGAIREIERKIQSMHPSVQDVATYIAAPLPKDLETSRANAAKRLGAARRTSEVQSAARLERLSVVDALAGSLKLLGTTIEAADPELEGRIATHITKHRLEPNGRKWIATSGPITAALNEHAISRFVLSKRLTAPPFVFLSIIQEARQYGGEQRPG